MAPLLNAIPPAPDSYLPVLCQTLLSNTPLTPGLLFTIIKAHPNPFFVSLLYELVSQMKQLERIEYKMFTANFLQEFQDLLTLFRKKES